MSRLTGNFNGVGTTNISDVQYLLNWIAGGGNTSKYNINIDYNGQNYIIDDEKILLDPSKNGSINISDAQYILNWIAAGGNSTKIGQYLDYNGQQYIIEYIADAAIWNSFIREAPIPKYRFFIEIYNIPKDDGTLLANIKENDGVIITLGDVQEDRVSSKSSVNSGFVTKYSGVNNIALNTDTNDPHGSILIANDTHYHKSLMVPMNTATATLNDIILYIFAVGDSYSDSLNNSGIQATLSVDDMVNNPVINNNDTIIIDNSTDTLYHMHNNTSTSIDLSSKLVAGGGVLFS
jgi:hypothetical protein